MAQVSLDLEWVFIGKTITIAKQAGTDQEEAIYDMLQAYRSIPHPAIKLPPYQLLMNREVRTTLDHFPTETQENDTAVRASDSRYKNKCKEYHDQRYKTTTHKMKSGDAVVVKRENKRKAQTIYKPYVYNIIEIKGSQISAKRMKDGRTITRDASRFKPLRKTESHVTLQRPEMIKEAKQKHSDKQTK